jgi:CheY-like chemotaxis protein
MGACCLSKGIDNLIFLVIDDDPFTRLLLSKILWSFGAGDVLTAESGEEGLRLLHACHIDLIICDVVMGGLSGLKFVKLVRDMHLIDDSGKHATPIVMLTAHADQQIVTTAMRLGADGCLVKPLSIGHLAKMIAKLCRVDEPSTGAAAAKRKAG